MRTLLKMEFSRLFYRKEFYLSLLVGVLLSVWMATEGVSLLQERVLQIATQPADAAAYYYLPSVFNKAIGIDHAALPSTLLFALLPILVIFPYATTYAEDCASGYNKNIQTRAFKKSWLLCKCIVTMFSAFLVALFTFAFSVFLSSILLPEIMPQMTAYTFPAAANPNTWSEIYRHLPYDYLLRYSLLDAGYYACFSTLALLISVFVRQRFVVLLAPAILFYLSTQLFGLLGCWNWMPEMFLRQYQPVELNLPIVLLQMTMLLLIGAGGFVVIGGRKDVL